MAMTPEIINQPQELNNPWAGYEVKYMKVNFDDPVSVSDLQNIETRALTGDGEIIIITQEKFSFQANYYYIVKYLQKP